LIVPVAEFDVLLGDEESTTKVNDPVAPKLAFDRVTEHLLAVQLKEPWLFATYDPDEAPE
jgi:hypothetical protein